MPTSDCPWIESWPALFSDTLSPEQVERLEEHLASCSACSERLDQVEEGDDTVRKLGRQVGDPTASPAHPELTHVLERLYGLKSPIRSGLAEPTDLYFLQPTERSELLGLLDEYEVQEVIGQGGFGVVLKAYEPALHRLVAIKVLSPVVAGSVTARRRFAREARAAAAVCHDHVVAVHRVHDTDGLPYLVMQYVAGESLQTRLDRTGPLEVLEIVRIGIQTTQGLAAAHAQGLIHRDIKPANLLLENGLARVKITDFGLARSVDDIGLTQDGVVAGTPEYMSPEQARGEAVDHRCDLFSLGSVLYTMCTGQAPFRGASTVAVLRQVSDHEPKPIRSLNPDVPEWLESFIARLLAKNPADRFQSAAEVATLLEGYLAHLRQPITVPVPQLPAQRTGLADRGTGSRGLVSRSSALLVALALVVLGTGVFFWLREVRFPEGAGEPAPQKELAQEYRLSFKDPAEDRGNLEIVGPDGEQCVHFEPNGLRITLPTRYDGPSGWHGERPDTGVAIPVVVKGDFEITVRFEILQEPEPQDAGFPQTRLSLDVAVDRAHNSVAALSRRVESSGGTEFLTWVSLWNEDAGKHEQHFKAFFTAAKTGRLRLTRLGSVVTYSVSEGEQAEFTQLLKYSFSAEDLEDVRILASTGGPKAALDARVSDLRVRAVSLSQTTPEPGSFSGIQKGSKGGAAITLAALLVLAATVGVWLAVRHNRRAANQDADPNEEDIEPEGAAPIAFSCAGCGKNLKARADLAGKKVKCPGCRKAVVLPENSTSVKPGPASP
jgi:serine/threonine protein kinase